MGGGQCGWPPKVARHVHSRGKVNRSTVIFLVEGAEDDAAAGARAIEFRSVGKRDVVVGIAASGHTPFVLGALTEAAQRGARPARPTRKSSERCSEVGTTESRREQTTV